MDTPIMDTYRQALSDALRELGELETEHERLELRISQLRKTIAGLRALCGEEHGNPDEEYEELGITDSVRTVLQANQDRDFTTSEVRELLESMGLLPRTYKNPLAVIYNVMRRLEASGEAEKVTRPDRKIGSKWKPKRFPRVLFAPDSVRPLYPGLPPDLEPLKPGLPPDLKPLFAEPGPRRKRNPMK